MTYEESLEIITNAIQTDKMTSEQDIALSMAQKAIEKQIPKKPVEGFPRDYKCNECHCTVFTVEHYCGNCGQAIDWSDEQ